MTRRWNRGTSWTLGPPPAGGVGANGPEDAILEWDAVDWRAAEDDVRRLRQRIFAATRAGDLKRVRSLQKLMLRSLSNTLLSVRQVTERNAGRLTPGVDGRVALIGGGQGTPGDRDPTVTAAGPAGETGVHPEGEWEAASARHPGDLRSRSAGSGA